MYEDIKIGLHPYLGCSKNLIEYFAIIGYEEKSLSLCPPNTLDKQSNIPLSIISEVKSDKDYDMLGSDLLIKQVYPDKPNIIKITKSTKKPIETNVIFSSCFDSLNGKKKIFYSCYALRLYEIYIDKKNIHYYVPKAFIIYSHYPYFTTFYNICSILLEFNEKGSIPIEMLLQIFVNHIPSPINKNIFLLNFKPKIIIPKLTGYPYTDFNLGRIFNILPINEFIKVYLLIFLETDLLFFSADIEKLNMTMFILYILNYPLTDSNYFWHIKSISKHNLEDGDDTLNTSFKGVNTNYSSNLELNEFADLYLIIDLENKKKKFLNFIKENKESKEIKKLLEYVNNILNHKNVKSYFLSHYLNDLRDKLINVKKDYDRKFTKNIPFFYVDNNITAINRKIQEIFYDFILNILVVLYKDLKYEKSSLEITKRKYKIKEFSEEENIFLDIIRDTIKYNTYFELFISNFTTSDQIKLSLLFSDEYTNLKMNDIRKQIPQHIDYFKIMDNFYSLKPGEIRVNYYNVQKEFKLIYDPDILNKLKKKPKKNQLFSLDKSILENFAYYQKRGLFKSLKENDNKNFIIESSNKLTIPLTIINHFNEDLKDDFFMRSSLIYIYCIVFPLFNFNTNIFYLTDILYELQKIKYFKRFYLNTLIKSINKYYLINVEKNFFPDLNFENLKNYCEIIRDNLIENKILPNEELYVFFEKLKNEANNKKIAPNKNNFIFQYEKDENYVKNIKQDIIVKENNFLIFNYQNKRIKYNFLFNPQLMFQTIYSIFENFAENLKFNLETFNYNIINEITINLIYYMLSYKDYKICCNLINMMIALKKWDHDLTIYKRVKIERPSGNNDNNSVDNNIENNNDNNIENKIDNIRASNNRVSNNSNRENNIINIQNNSINNQSNIINNINRENNIDINRESSINNRESNNINRESNYINRESYIIFNIENNFINRESNNINRESDVINRKSNINNRASNNIDNNIINRESNNINRESNNINRGSNNTINRESNNMNSDSNINNRASNNIENNIINRGSNNINRESNNNRESDKNRENNNNRINNIENNKIINNEENNNDNIENNKNDNNRMINNRENNKNDINIDK